MLEINLSSMGCIKTNINLADVQLKNMIYRYFLLRACKSDHSTLSLSFTVLHICDFLAH